MKKLGLSFLSILLVSVVAGFVFGGCAIPFPFEGYQFEFDVFVTIDQEGVGAVETLAARHDTNNVVVAVREWLNSQGLNSTVTRRGNSRIRVRMATRENHIDDIERHNEFWGARRDLVFKNSDNTVILTGEHFASISYGQDPRTGGTHAVVINLTAEGAREFSLATANVGEIISIYLITGEHSRLISAPLITAQITDGRIAITGFLNLQEARTTATSMLAHALNFRLQEYSLEFVPLFRGGCF